VSAIGILGGLAAAGAAYKEGKRNKEREARLEKYDAALTDLRSAQAEQLRAGMKPNLRPDMASTDSMLASATVVDPETKEQVAAMARGGVVGYANGGLVDYNNSPAGDRMAVSRVCDFVDSSWQRQSFKK